MRIDRYALKMDAKRSLRAAKPGAIRMTLLYFLLTSGLSMVAGLFIEDPIEKIQVYMNAGLDPLQAAIVTLSGVGMLGLFLNIFLFIFGAALDYGYFFWILGSSRGGIGEYSDLICGFSMAGRVLLLRLCVMLFQFFWYVAIFIPVVMFIFMSTVVPLLGGLFTVAAVVAAVVVYVGQVLRYSMATYCFIDDPDAGFFMAIQRSRELMKGNCWNYFKLMLSFFWWYALEALIAVGAQMLVFMAVGGPEILPGLFNGQPWAYESAGMISSGVWGILIGVVPWVLNAWLTPYITMVEAKFYDLIRNASPKRQTEETRYTYR